MTVIAAVCALALIVGVLWDAFETIILPRRVRRRLRLTSVIYRLTWTPWALLGRRLRRGREGALSLYGPLALLFLLAVWAVILIIGFAVLQWALGSRLLSPSGSISFGTDLYMSGTTFFTLGLGDVVPISPLSRAVTVLESGTGFAFLALVIGYLPILYQAFSRREVAISLLDARAGSPPTAAELLRRNAERGSVAALMSLLSDWEHWSAELLESHLSYPSLGYFRSQHEDQSWLASLTAILDVCALVLVGIVSIFTHWLHPTTYSWLTLLIFTGLVLVDFARIRAGGDGLSPVQLAVQIYLDAINIFLAILQLLGGRRRD